MLVSSVIFLSCHREELLEMFQQRNYFSPRWFFVVVVIVGFLNALKNLLFDVKIICT